MTRYMALLDGEAGAYGVIFPDLPGCTAMGDTIAGAIRNAHDALRDWVEVGEAYGDTIPEPSSPDTLRARADVQEALAEQAAWTCITLIRDGGRVVKANLTLHSGVLAAIDGAAKARNLTRSAFVELMAKQAIPDMA